MNPTERGGFEAGAELSRVSVLYLVWGQSWVLSLGMIWVRGSGTLSSFQRTPVWERSAAIVEWGCHTPCGTRGTHGYITVGDFSPCRSCPCSTCSDTVSVCAPRSPPTCTSTCSASRAALRTPTTTEGWGCLGGLQEEWGFHRSG